MRRLVRSAFAIAIAAGALPAMAFAQEGATVSGKVTSDAGAPLNSASVFIEGLNIGTLTKEDGRYSFTVPSARVSGQQVTISARLIGYKAKSATITLNNGPIAQDFVLESNPLRLGEVVVTGAGTVSTREKLGAVINTVDSSAIAKSHETNVVNALAGQAPNVSVNSQSGEPGASSYIRIRGVKSLSGDGQPLFVVDGTPIDNSSIPTEGIDATDPNGSLGGTVNSNRASDIDPNDIESVEILKGAAAAAIYGARASDGVILITTKSGKSGATRFNLRSNYSFDDVNRDIPLQRQFGQGSEGSFSPCTDPDCRNTSSSWGPQLAAGTPTYDHWGELFDTGHLWENSLSVSGGNDKTSFFLSGGYTTQDGVIIGPNNSYSRATVRLKATHRLIDRLQVSGNFAYVDASANYVQKGSNVSGLLLGGARTSPDFNNFPALDPVSGLHRSYRFPNPSPASLTSGRGYDNPVYTAFYDPNTSDLNRVYGNIGAELQAADWLTIKDVVGADYYTDDRLNALSLTSSSFPTGEIFRDQISNLEIDQNLFATATHTFNPNFGMSFTAGWNLNSRDFRSNFVNGQTLLAAQPYALQNTVTWIPNEYKYLIHTESYYAQATFDLYNQLYLTGAVRNDGFSTFGKSEPRAWYPKGSAAWTFTNLWNPDQKGTLSFGKFRIAYGETGKAPDPYATQTVLLAGQTFGTGFGDALNASQGSFGGLFSSLVLGNQDLKPERQKEFETGFDLGFLNQKVDFGATYYENNAVDVILPVPVPPSTGYNQALQNGAHIRNVGYELTLNARPYTTKDVAWDFGINWSQNRTRVVSLAGAEFVSNANQFAGTFAGANGAATVGNTIGLRGNDFVRCGRGITNVADNLGNNIANVDAECGSAPKGALFIDATGFPVFDPTDRAISNPDANWLGSFHTSVRIKKWTVSALIDHKQNGQIWNGTRGALYNFGTHKDTEIRGQTRTFGVDYMQGPTAGPGAGTAVVLDQDSWFQGGNGSGFVGPSSFNIEDGTYTKLREVSVGYTFDQPWVGKNIGLSSIDLRVAGRNLYTWTKYDGIDPETNLGGSAVVVQGIDYFNNPQTRSIVISVGLNR